MQSTASGVRRSGKPICSEAIYYVSKAFERSDRPGNTARDNSAPLFFGIVPSFQATLASMAVDGPAGNLRKRKSNSAIANGDSNGHGPTNAEIIANGQSMAVLKINARPTEHGQEMDKKLDEHQT